MVGKILNDVRTWSRFQKILIQLLIDYVLLSAAFLTAIALKFENVDYLLSGNIWLVSLISASSAILFMHVLGIYRSITRYTSFYTLKYVALSSSFSAICIWLISLAAIINLPGSVLILYGLLGFMFLSMSRLGIGYLYSSQSQRGREAIAIYGAGEAGRQLLTSLNQSPTYKPAVFIDDDKVMHGLRVGDVKVLGFADAVESFEAKKISTVLIAIPSATFEQRSSIIEKLEPHAVKVKALPSVSELIEGKLDVNQLRNLTVEELLGREPIPPKQQLLSKNIPGKSILVTGAGGSIGSELCRKIIRQRPKCLVLFDNSEFNLYRINLDLSEELKKEGISVDLVAVMGSVRDFSRVGQTIRDNNIDTIFHAAAYKHVPLVEMNAAECIMNNVIGTVCVVRSAVENRVETMTVVSTDKAVRPTNVMGASKRIAELICQAYSRESEGTVISMVRFGNVLGSSGSVIPRFASQIENGGPITVTHRDITRFFMTVDEAAELVIQAGAMAKGGEVFVLEMGQPVKILDLAFKMARLNGLKPFISGQQTEPSAATADDIEIEIVGLRPGEKLFEEVLIGHDPQPTEHERIFSAREISLPLKDVHALVDTLTSLSDKAAIVDCLKEAPIEFKPHPG